jgi:hypothetical protein
MLDLRMPATGDQRKLAVQVTSDRLTQTCRSAAVTVWSKTTHCGRRSTPVWPLRADIQAIGTSGAMVAE